MESITVTLVSEDEDYARALIGGLNDTHPFFVMSWKENIESLDSSDIVIYDESFELEDVVQENFAVSLSSNSDCEPPAIFRYCSAGIMGDEILHRYVEATDRRLSSMGILGSKIILVSSTRGGSGSTSICQALATQLCLERLGRSLIIECSPLGYLGGELSSLVEKKEDDDEEESYKLDIHSPFPLRNLIYYLLKGRKNMAATIGSYIGSSEYWDYFNYGGKDNPLAELSDDEAAQFFSKLREYCDRDFIIIDMGNIINNFAMIAMKHSDICILVEGWADVFTKNGGDLRIIQKYQEGFMDKKVVRCFNRMSEEEFKRKAFVVEDDEDELYRRFNSCFEDEQTDEIFIPSERMNYGMKNLIKLLI